MEKKITDRNEYLDQNKTYGIEVIDIELANGNSVDCDLSFRMELDEYYEPDTEEENEKLERGDLTPVVLSVIASFDGINETEYLGGVLLSEPVTGFNVIEDYIKPYGIDKAACESLKTRLEDFIKKLDPEACDNC